MDETFELLNIFGSTASLNSEWVQITNNTTGTVSLTGWTLTDASRHTY
ncbi:hypothetical protein ACF087_35965 [Streptomyces goshikiensis]